MAYNDHNFRPRFTRGLEVRGPPGLSPGNVRILPHYAAIAVPLNRPNPPFLPPFLHGILWYFIEFRRDLVGRESRRPSSDSTGFQQTFRRDIARLRDWTEIS